MTEIPHPRQPLVLDGKGVVRFRANAICRWLVDAGLADLTRITVIGFSDEDRRQFAQLIGYSVSGYGDLSYVSPEEAGECDAIAEEVVPGPDSPQTTELDPPETYEQGRADERALIVEWLQDTFRDSSLGLCDGDGPATALWRAGDAIEKGALDRD